jgi:hypothetical protein
MANLSGRRSPRMHREVKKGKKGKMEDERWMKEMEDYFE